MQRFVSELVKTVEVCVPRDDPRTMTVDNVKFMTDWLRTQHITLDDVQQYITWDESKPYTRNLVATDYKSFTLLILCWNPGMESVIHDHNQSHCFMKVVTGKIVETRYHTHVTPHASANNNGQALKQLTQQTMSEQNVTFINDSYGLHKISNASEVARAITLHCYVPPYRFCNKYDSVTGVQTSCEIQTDGVLPFGLVHQHKPPANLSLSSANENCGNEHVRGTE